MILVGTGHRPDKLRGGYSEETYVMLRSMLGQVLIELKPSIVISGMALGFDQALAAAAVYSNIPFMAALPFESQDSRWPDTSKARYRALLEHAQSVHVCSKTHSVDAFQRRNEWMVDQLGPGDVLLTFWNGSAGGTANCIEYAMSKRDAGFRIVPTWERWAARHEYPSAPISLSTGELSALILALEYVAREAETPLLMQFPGDEDGARENQRLLDKLVKQRNALEKEGYE